MMIIGRETLKTTIDGTEREKKTQPRKIKWNEQYPFDLHKLRSIIKAFRINRHNHSLFLELNFLGGRKKIPIKKDNGRQF